MGLKKNTSFHNVSPQCRAHSTVIVLTYKFEKNFGFTRGDGFCRISARKTKSCMYANAARVREHIPGTFLEENQQTVNKMSKEKVLTMS